MLRLTKTKARRIAVAAQLIGRQRRCNPGMRDVARVIDRLGQFQIDSVNVLARAHLMPLFSRLGPYDTGLLKRAAEESPRRLFEFWGHAASLIDVRLAPALGFRMREHSHRPWHAMSRVLRERPELIFGVRDEIRTKGPMTPRELSSSTESSGSRWWGWSDTKAALEWLFYTGELSVAGRNSAFERRYDLIERVLPVHGLGELPDAEAHLTLVRRAAEALGIASLTCLGDYFRLSSADTRRAVETLARSGELVAAEVEGWPTDLWMWHAAKRPKVVEAATIVAPFDPLAFERRRLLALFGMDYRIEIYTPAPQRRFGYYVYPFLFGDSFDARVDLKADRSGGRLVVKAAWLEEHAEGRAQPVATALAGNLAEVASWLGLDDIAIENRGTLATGLRHALG